MRKRGTFRVSRIADEYASYTEIAVENLVENKIYRKPEPLISNGYGFYDFHLPTNLFEIRQI